MKPMNLQDTFLNQVRKEHAQVTVYLTNGYQSKGIIRGFDNFVIILEVDGKSQMIYKHAVSTVIPVKPMTFTLNDKSENENE